MQSSFRGWGTRRHKRGTKGGQWGTRERRFEKERVRAILGAGYGSVAAFTAQYHALDQQKCVPWAAIIKRNIAEASPGGLLPGQPVMSAEFYGRRSVEMNPGLWKAAPGGVCPEDPVAFLKGCPGKMLPVNGGKPALFAVGSGGDRGWATETKRKRCAFEGRGTVFSCVLLAW